LFEDAVGRGAVVYEVVEGEAALVAGGQLVVEVGDALAVPLRESTTRLLSFAALDAAKAAKF
jgi:hypothetical protein